MYRSCRSREIFSSRCDGPDAFSLHLLVRRLEPHRRHGISTGRETRDARREELRDPRLETTRLETRDARCVSHPSRFYSQRVGFLSSPLTGLGPPPPGAIATLTSTSSKLGDQISAKLNYIPSLHLGPYLGSARALHLILPGFIFQFQSSGLRGL
jgi:hypothetical protein